MQRAEKIKRETGAEIDQWFQGIPYGRNWGRLRKELPESEAPQYDQC